MFVALPGSLQGTLRPLLNGDQLLQVILFNRGQFRGQTFDKPCDFSSMATYRATSSLKINVEDRFRTNIVFFSLRRPPEAFPVARDQLLQGVLLTRGQFRGQPYYKPCDFSSMAASRATTSTTSFRIYVRQVFFSIWHANL